MPSRKSAAELTPFVLIMIRIDAKYQGNLLTYQLYDYLVFSVFDQSDVRMESTTRSAQDRIDEKSGGGGMPCDSKVQSLHADG